MTVCKAGATIRTLSAKLKLTKPKYMERSLILREMFSLKMISRACNWPKYLLPLRENLLKVMTLFRWLVDLHWNRLNVIWIELNLSWPFKIANLWNVQPIFVSWILRHLAFPFFGMDIRKLSTQSRSFQTRHFSSQNNCDLALVQTRRTGKRVKRYRVKITKKKTTEKQGANETSATRITTKPFLCNPLSILGNFAGFH